MIGSSQEHSAAVPAARRSCCDRSRTVPAEGGAPRRRDDAILIVPTHTGEADRGTVRTPCCGSQCGCVNGAEALQTACGGSRAGSQSGAVGPSTPDGSLDLIRVRCALNQAADRGRAIAGAYHALAPTLDGYFDQLVRAGCREVRAERHPGSGRPPGVGWMPPVAGVGPTLNVVLTAIK